MQVVSSAAIKEIVAIATSDAQSELGSQCLQTLYELIIHTNVRPVFGAADGIRIFTEKFKSEEIQTEKIAILNVLCLCSKESVNRVKLRENGVLQIFLESLQDHSFHKIHDRIISCLVCFIYDEAGFHILLEAGLVKILLKHLQRVAQFQTSEWTVDDFICNRRDEEWFGESDRMFQKYYTLGNDHDLEPKKTEEQDQTKISKSAEKTE